MKSIYKEYITKLNRFNQWEAAYEAKKTELQKIAEFCHLFELAMQMPAEIKEKAHHEHLESLIAVQRRLWEWAVDKDTPTNTFSSRKEIGTKSSMILKEKRSLVVNIAKSFAEAEQWDIEQQIRMTPNERFAVLRVLKDRVYGLDAKDVRECHQDT